MMKKILLIIFTIIIGIDTATSQSVKNTGNSSKELVPQGWTVEEVKGDLNKDKVDDLVIIAKPEPVDGENQPPVLAIYWGNAQGGYTLYKAYEDMVPYEIQEDDEVTIKMEITDRGVWKIGIKRWVSVGCENNYSDSFVYRYQNNAFHLIGYDSDVINRCEGVETEQSINFSTKKKQTITTENETGQSSEKWETIPDKPLQKLEDGLYLISEIDE